MLGEVCFIALECPKFDLTPSAAADTTPKGHPPLRWRREEWIQRAYLNGIIPNP